LDPDPKLGVKWDPDPKKIVTDPQHWHVVPVPVVKEAVVIYGWCMPAYGIY
jgi:hypothetical protein